MKTSFPKKLLLIGIAIVCIRITVTPSLVHADDVMLYNTHADTTLDSSLMYEVDANVIVFPGATLTIPAGTHLLFTAGSHLRVDGTLVVNGTANNHVVVTGGVPHLGAPKTFKTLMYGDSMGFQFSMGNALQVPILDPDRVKAISQNMPSVYELLPSQKYFDVIGSYISNLVQSPAPLAQNDIEQLMIADGRNKKMFPFAQTLHDATDDLDTSKFSAYDFVGCGATKTITGFSLTQEESLTLTGLKLLPEHRLSYGAGDGVVPMNSANAGNGAVNYYFASGLHGTLPATSPVEKGIMNILNNVAISNDIGLSTTPASCYLSGDIVEVHSPVTLDIYDDQGRHTGPTADGSIEMGIPNVDYEMIGDEKFAFLPNGPKYTIVNHAQAIGSYDMYISHSINDDSITHETYFHAVPLTSADAIGTVIVVPNNPDYTISMDEDGDGAADSVIQPTASLNAAQAKDIVPPVTTATIKDSTVTLTASDDNAGVLDTKYSTDGITWNIYSAPFEVKAGTTVQFVSMDKAGNVENIQQLAIPAAPTTNYYTTTTTIVTNPAPASDTDASIDQPDDNTIDNADDITDINPDNSTVPPSDTTPADTPDSAPTLPAATPITANSTTSPDDSVTADTAFSPSISAAAKNNSLSEKLTASVPVVPIRNGLLVMMLLVACLIIALIIKSRF